MRFATPRFATPRFAPAALALGLSFTLGLATGEVRGQPNATEPRDPVFAEAPIAGGNRALAKERALTEALRLSVERVFAEVNAAAGLDPSAPVLGAWRASWAQRPRRYVRTYRIVEESEEGGYMRVRVAADVDAVALRRDAERALATRPPGERPGPPAVAAPRSALLLAPPQLQGAALQAASVLRAAGLLVDVRTQAAEGAVDRAGVAPTQAFVQLQGNAKVEGPVRGTLDRAVACELTLRVLPQPGLAAPPPRKVEDWGFAADDALATTACYERVASTAVRGLLPVLAPPARPASNPGAAAGDIAVTVTGASPGPVARVLTALRSQIPGLTPIGGLRLERGRAQLTTRSAMTPEALAGAIGRAVGSNVIVATVDARPGQLLLDARDAATP